MEQVESGECPLETFHPEEKSLQCSCLYSDKQILGLNLLTGIQTFNQFRGWPQKDWGIYQVVTWH